MDDGHQLASLLDMRYKPCLSQNEHLLVLKCALPLEACEDSSSQHGLIDLSQSQVSAELDLGAQVFLKEAKERSYFCDSETYLSFFQMPARNKIHRNTTSE